MWRRVNIGGIDLRETVTAGQSGEVVRVVGQESHPPSTREAVSAAHHNIVALEGLTVPVVFGDKDGLTGFYLVESAESDLTDEQNGHLLTATWAVSMRRVGGARDVEMETKLPMVARQDTLPGTQTAVFWHAPPVGTTDYFTGPSVPPASVIRQSADGPVKVYLGIPTGVAPRWTVPIGSFMDGAARILFAGQRRVGKTTPPGAVWEMNNGLVRLVAGSDGTVTVSTWDQLNQEWASPRGFGFSGAALLTATPELTILRNDPEEVTIRLTYPQSPGRTQIDFGIRRGSRFVTGIIKTHSAAYLSVNAVPGFAATAQTGGVRQTAADANGNRVVIGSAVLHDQALAAGAIGRAASVTFPFFIGHEVGTSPQAGDAFADLLAQYLGNVGEWNRVIRR